MLHEDYFSFLGLHAIPVRHGMTMSEMGLMMAAEKSLHIEFSVLEMNGWERGDYFADTGLPWVYPSPNLPTLESLYFYPGMELLEGTNLSEGRGTTKPFELIGAPHLNAQKLAATLNEQKHPGVIFRPASFEPTFDKWQGEVCFGVQMHALNPKQIRSVTIVTALMQAAMEQAGETFQFNPPPYEYEAEKMPFDILSGSDQLRQDLLANKPWRQIVKSWDADLKSFRERREPYLLYR